MEKRPKSWDMRWSSTGVLKTLLRRKLQKKGRKGVPRTVSARGQKSFRLPKKCIFLKMSPKPEKNLKNSHFRAEKTMTATDVTGFDAIFSTGFFATFSRFWRARLTKLHITTGEKAKNPVESLQCRRRPKIADFCPLSWSNLSWHFRLFFELFAAPGPTGPLSAPETPFRIFFGVF